MRKLLISLLCLFFASTGFAKVQTEVIITKTSTLSGEEARQFTNTFGHQFEGDQRFHFHCLTQDASTTTCKITTTKGGFSGELATALLRGRESAVFRSQDGNFRLHCGIYHGNTAVSFCNVTQKKAVLD